MRLKIKTGRYTWHIDAAVRKEVRYRMPNKQAPAQRDAGPARFRFTVPLADTDVIDWIGAQDNLGISLRYIIKKAIAEEGITDAFCGPLVSGRPAGKRRRAARQEAGTGTGTDTALVAGPAPAQTAAAPDAGQLKPPVQAAPVIPDRPILPPQGAVAEPQPVPQSIQEPVSGTEATVDGDGFIDPDSFFN